MDIKKLLVCDDTGEKVVESLKNSNLNVDIAFDISPQKLLTVVHVSVTLIHHFSTFDSYSLSNQFSPITHLIIRSTTPYS